MSRMTLAKQADSMYGNLVSSQAQSLGRNCFEFHTWPEKLFCSSSVEVSSL